MPKQKKAMKQKHCENPALGCYISTIFAHERYLAPIDLRFRQAGIMTIRDLVAIPRKELFQRFKTTEANKQRIQKALKEVGLSLH
jgi:hypothetical protein